MISPRSACQDSLFPQDQAKIKTMALAENPASGKISVSSLKDHLLSLKREGTLPEAKLSSQQTGLIGLHLL